MPATKLSPIQQTTLDAFTASYWRSTKDIHDSKSDHSADIGSTGRTLVSLEKRGLVEMATDDRGKRFWRKA